MIQLLTVQSALSVLTVAHRTRAVTDLDNSVRRKLPIMILEDEEKCEEMANVRRRFLEQGGTECVNQIRGFITEVASKCSQDEAPACQDFLWSIFTCGEHMVSKATHRKRHGDTAENARSDNIIPDWYAPLIQASRSGALLWAGFWDGDESGRGTLQALEDFARMVDHDPVHPNTYVGRAVRNQDDFQSCFKDGSKTAKRAMHHFWTYTSFAFVTGMAMRDQRWVIAIVNKPMEGERALQDSVAKLCRQYLFPCGPTLSGSDAQTGPCRHSLP